MKKSYLFVAGILALSLASCSVKEDIAKLKKQVKYSASDSDRDGVPNIHDKDNSTDPEVKVYGDGTAVDTDGDGVADHLDQELISPRFVNVDSLGRAMDGDGDGVPDGIDLEKNTAKGQIVNFQGKSIAAAAGGAAGSAGASAGMGGANMSQFPIVLFSYRKELENTTYPAIVAMANYMKANPGAKITVTGHTDSIGPDKDNETLGMDRANVVIEELAKLGIDKGRMTAATKGEKEPTKLKYAKMNRRVEFSLNK